MIPIFLPKPPIQLKHLMNLQPYEIDISALDRAEMVAALYNATTGPLGPPYPRMTKDEAQAEIDRLLEGEQGNRWYFDYLRGRCMKIHFGKDILDTRLYDRDHGQGAAKAALAPLLAHRHTTNHKPT
jgi:hypothetical protein